MNWNWLSWIVMGAVLLGGGVFVYATVSSKKDETVVLPPPPKDKPKDPEPEPPPPPPPPKPPGQTAELKLPKECEPLRGKVPNFPETLEQQIAFCNAWTEIVVNQSQQPEPPTDVCGPDKVVKSLRELDQCARLNAVCELHLKDAPVSVDLADILSVADRFPVYVVYFEVGQHSVSKPEELRNWVGKQLDVDKKRALMVFGSASPTARVEDYDIKLARKRTEAAFKTVNEELSERRLFGVPTRKANIGRGLREDFCAAFGDQTDLQRECYAHDANGRRQAAFVVSYPRQCLEPEG